MSDTNQRCCTGLTNELAAQECTGVFTSVDGVIQHSQMPAAWWRARACVRVCVHVFSTYTCVLLSDSSVVSVGE